MDLRICGTISPCNRSPTLPCAARNPTGSWGPRGTRAMTAFNSKTGCFHLTTVGRVQTPTLAILVEREEKIKKFVAKAYWEIHGTFDAQAGQYPGRWFDENFTRREGEPDLRAERLWDSAKAEEIQRKCLGKVGIATEESKP